MGNPRTLVARDIILKAIDYFKSKPVTIPKITILLDHGDHIDHLIEALEQVYPQMWS